MARSQLELQEILTAVGEDLDVFAVYFQPPTKMIYPCIKYERDNSWISRADNVLYLFHKRYQVTVIDRDPASAIPDRVEALPHTRFDRFNIKDGLNQWTYNLYF